MLERKNSYDRALQYQRVPTVTSLDTRPFDEMSRYENLEENTTHQTHSLANNLSAISDDEGDDVSKEAGGDENAEDTHNQGLSFSSMDKLVLSISSVNNRVLVGNSNNEDNRSEAGTSKSGNSRTSRHSNRPSSRNSQATGSRTRSKNSQAGKPQDNIDNVSVFSYVSDANKSVAHSAAMSTKSAQSGSTSKSKSSRLSAAQASDAYLKICGGAGSSSAHDQLDILADVAASSSPTPNSTPTRKKNSSAAKENTIVQKMIANIENDGKDDDENNDGSKKDVTNSEIAKMGLEKTETVQAERMIMEEATTTVDQEDTKNVADDEAIAETDNPEATIASTEESRRPSTGSNLKKDEDGISTAVTTLSSKSPSHHQLYHLKKKNGNCDDAPSSLASSKGVSDRRSRSSRVFTKLKSQRFFGGKMKQHNNNEDPKEEEEAQDKGMGKSKMVSHVPVLEEAKEDENGNDGEVVGEDVVRKSDAEEVPDEATADPTGRDSSSVDIECVKDSTRNTDSASPTPGTLASSATPTSRDATPPAFPIDEIGIDNDKSKGLNGTRNRDMYNPKGLSTTSTAEVVKVGDIHRVGSTSTDGTVNVTLESGSNVEEDTGNLATLLLGDDASLIIDVALEYYGAPGSLIDTAPGSLITTEDENKDEPGLLSSGVVSGLFERMFSCGTLPLQCNANDVAGEVKSAAGEVKSIVKKIQCDSKNNVTRGESTIFPYEEKMDEAFNIELFKDGNNGTRIMGHVDATEEGWENVDDEEEEASSDQSHPSQSQPEEGGDGGSAARNASKKEASAKNEHVSNKRETNKITSKSGKTGDDGAIDPSEVTSKIIYKTRVAPGFEMKSNSKNNDVIVDSISVKIDTIGRKLEKKREREAALKNGGRKNRIRLNLFKKLKEKKEEKKLRKVARNGRNVAKGESPSSSATRKEKRRRSKAVSKAARASGGRPKLNAKQGSGTEGEEYNDLNEPFDAQ